MLWILYAAALTAVIATFVTLVELVAPLERHSLQSRVRGLLFIVLQTALGVLLLALLKSLWRALGVQPLVACPDLAEPASIMLALVLSDFVAYWNHRFQHRFLWPIHAVHHSQTELHAANSYAHFLERPLRFLAFGIPLSLIDFHLAATPFVVMLASEGLAFYIHSPTSVHFGPLAKILVDNRFHRIHHSLEPRHFDKNFGVMFSVWDRIFGTACEPEEGCWPNVGLDGNPPPRSVPDYLLYPLRFPRPRAEVRLSR